MAPRVVLIHELIDSGHNPLVYSETFEQTIHDEAQAKLVGEAVMEAVVAYNKANPSKKIHTLLVPDPAPLISKQFSSPAKLDDPTRESQRERSIKGVRRGYFEGLLKDFATNDGNRPVIEMSCDNPDRTAIKKAMKRSGHLNGICTRTHGPSDADYTGKR
eukprot:GHVU01002719.1.p1 GENE.GHVU01002719.1~~GHVU01002719.1.p1  ORF type:complete len:160 (+),score=18.08 GHVU01002719.1:180-659(+)